MAHRLAQTESPPLDPEDWQIVFAAYEEFPILALILGQHLECLKTFIQRGPEGQLEAVAALDRAIETLMPHTVFRDAGRNVYLLAVAGKLPVEQER